MSTSSITKSARKKVLQKRAIFDIKGDTPGPVVIFLGAVHGNEPAGVLAMERAAGRLRERQSALHGQALGLIGNVKAFRKNQRYLDRDLNRIWTTPALSPTLHSFSENAEEEERRDLLAALKPYLFPPGQPVYIVDLHTTSAPSSPFVIISDAIRNRRFARHFLSPIILGLEERVEGTILNYMSDIGVISLAFEAGQHQDEQSILRHEAAIWTALAGAGCLAEQDIPDFSQQQTLLKLASEGLHQFYETRYRYSVDPQEDFRMKPGFRNFQTVRRGEIVAENRSGPIRAAAPRAIFMPLYQEQGDDGFFLIKPIQPFWLRLSEWLRRRKAERLAKFIPGVRLNPENKQELIIASKRLLSWIINILHLLGYRKQREKAQHIIVTKRKFDWLQK